MKGGLCLLIMSSQQYIGDDGVAFESGAVSGPPNMLLSAHFLSQFNTHIGLSLLAIWSGVN